MVPTDSAPPKERRKNHALRALYLRVDTQEKIVNDLQNQLAILEGGAVTFKWLMGTLLGLFVTAMVGAFTLVSKTADTNAASEKRSADVTARLADKLERSIEAQADAKVKTEALYLLFVEQKPRTVVREEVKRKTEEK